MKGEKHPKSNTQQLLDRINILKRKSLNLRLEANEIDKQIHKITDNLKNVCNHPTTKIQTESYEEPPRIKYHEWREKVCTVCGKVLGISEKKSEWTKFR